MSGYSVSSSPAFPSPTGFYKVLDAKSRSCHGGNGHWVVGKRRSVRGTLAPCENDLHVVTLKQLPVWLGESIHPVLDCSEERVDGDSKWVVRWAVIGPAYETWNERSARHFAADCAARALREVKRTHGWSDKRANAAVRVARRFADGTTDDAARSAARSAACSAAYSAACSAAYSAAKVGSVSDPRVETRLRDCPVE